MTESVGVPRRADMTYSADLSDNTHLDKVSWGAILASAVWFVVAAMTASYAGGYIAECDRWRRDRSLVRWIGCSNHRYT